MNLFRTLSSASWKGRSVRRTEIDVLDPPAVRLMAGGSLTGSEKASAQHVIARALTEAKHPAQDARIRITRHRGRYDGHLGLIAPVW